MSKNKRIKYLLLILVLITALIWSFFSSLQKQAIIGDYTPYITANSLIDIKHEKNKAITYEFLNNKDDEMFIILADTRFSYLSYASLAFAMSYELEADVVVLASGIFNKIELLFKLKAYEDKQYTLIAHGNSGELAYLYAKKAEIQSMVYLSSYSSQGYQASYPTLFIRGNLDGILDEKTWLKKSLNSKSENVLKRTIDKANFTNFTQSALLKDDHVGLLDYQEQQEITIKYIQEFVKASIKN